MINPEIYIVTCDKTNHILNATIPFLDKYWNIDKKVNILGFNKPNIELPSDYNFISMKPNQLSIEDWSNDIANILEQKTDEYIIFMLDDSIPIEYVNPDILNKFYSMMENDKTIVRCSLGIDLYVNAPHNVIEKCDGYEIIEQTQNSDYRITTQPSIWKREYLISYLRKSSNPWSFETKNKANDNSRIIATKDKYCFRWIEETALSGRHPNKVNILGMKPSDIKWCIDNNIFDENNLQYGQHIGRVPQFKDCKYNFKIEILKNFVSKLTYDLYVIKYKKIYE
jgi:hypothetical protein